MLAFGLKNDFENKRSISVTSYCLCCFEFKKDEEEGCKLEEMYTHPPLVVFRWRVRRQRSPKKDLEKNTCRHR